jgi:capsular polysaccharide biosynthesis protein/tetratricopeptide (TPR) repeat protein
MDQESNEKKLERAMRLHDAGRLEHAEALYRELLRDQPGHQVALHLCGLIAHQRGRHREAVSLMEMAIAGGATNVAIYTNCGLAYRALGELDQAARQIAWAIALDPESADAHFNYALVLLDQGLQQQAAVHLEIVLELRPDSPKASICLGRIYLDDDKPALAAEKLRAALPAQTGEPAAHYLLAKALLAQGDTRGALASLNAALERQPDYALAAGLAAQTGFELCREAEALARLDQAQAGAAEGAKALRAAAARLGQIDLCSAADGGYTRLARPQWLSLPQPRALPEEQSQHFALPKPFTHEIFMARLAQVRVLPQELLLLTGDGRLLLDGVIGFPQQYALREGGAIRHCADDGRLLLALPQRRVEADAACVWLGAASGHFQWVFESLARLWVVEQKPGLQNLPLIVPAVLTRWQDELLQLLDYGRERRIAVPQDALLECRELHAASMVSVGFFVSPVAIQHLRRAFARRVAPAPAAPRRIYLSRRGAATRRLANEDELLPLLEQHGFVAVHAETLSATEQLALFQSAEVILGVEGAALVNLLIAPAHAKVGVIVASGLYRPRHYYISAPIGQDFVYLCAKPDYASHTALAECDVTLPRASLQAFLAAL